jgi:hypothetical protein
MSLLAELEELQRCLEGTADSDSEDASPAADCRISEKEDESSLAKSNEDEPEGFIQDPISRYPVHTETVCKISNVTQDEIGLDTASVVTGRCLERSALKSDRLEPTAQMSRVQTSSQESGATKVHTSRSCRQEATTVDMVAMKDVLPESGTIQANVSRGSADEKVFRGKILADSCTKKDSPSKDKKRDELKTPSNSEEVMILACKVPDTSELTKGSTSTDSMSKSVSKPGVESQVSEPETSPISSPALFKEDPLIFKELKVEGVADVSKSSFLPKEDASKLQTVADNPANAARQAQDIVPSTGKSEVVKLPSVPLKMQASDSGPVGSKSENESSSPLQASQSTHKTLRPCVNSTANRKSLLEADRHTGGRVQPTPTTSVFSVESKIAPTLEEVRISNNRPVIRVLSVSPDSKKNKSETAAVSVGSPSSLSAVRGGHFTRQGGPANSPPGVTKRNVSFETGSAVGHVLQEEQPTVVIETCKQENSRQLGRNEEGTNIRKRKLSAGAESQSVKNSSLQRVPETSEPTVKQKSCDISVVEADIRVDSGCLLQKKVKVHQDSEGNNKQEFWSQLGLEKATADETSEAVIVGTPLLRKRRAASDPMAFADDSKSEGFSLSGAKRRKLSASELSGPPEEPLSSESAGNVTMAQSSPNKIVPITSAAEVTILPQGFKQNVHAVPLSKSQDGHEVEDEDADLEKEDPGKEFMKAKVVLKKLNIPVPEHLLSVPSQDANTAKAKPQHLQRTLEKVSKLLQVTLTESSPPKKRKTARPRKLQDGLEEPIKGQNIVKRPVPRPKVIDKPRKQKILGKQDQQKVVRRQVQQKMIRKVSQQKIAGKPSQHKCPEKSKPQKAAGKSSQQKLVSKAKQQKTLRKPVQRQKTVSRTKRIKKSSSSKWPNIAIRIASNKKKVVPKTEASSKSKTKSQLPRKSKTDLQRMAPSITAKKTMKQVAFRNPKYKQSVKSSAVNARPEGQKNKNMTLNGSKQNKFDAKEKRVFLKKNMKETSQLRENGMVLLETEMRRPAVKAAKTFQQKSPAVMSRSPEPKKVATVDKRVKKPQQIAIEPGKPDGCSTGADDEWIVEVLLDDSEIDMMTLNSQVKVGQDANISKVSSSDDSPKDLHVRPSDLDTGHSLECDSSTDMNKRKAVLGVGKNVRGNICGNESNMVLNMHQKREVALPSAKQATRSCSMDRRSNISAEKKMVEMRKAIGDLERIADRSMLRLKAEERQVVYLTNRLYEYENDKHHIMLRKILRDAAPGPKQNPHAEFILDLVLSYCPEDDATVSS